jgi:hypothetical protein
MILDMQTLFSDAQALTASAASTNVIDLGVARDIGKGVPIPVLIQLVADATGTSPTLQVDLEVDDNEGFASAKVVQSASISGGVAGDKLPPFFLPEGVDERYCRLNYTLGGTSPTYDITAGFSMGNQTNITG